jgi:hypothetical protein
VSDAATRLAACKAAFRLPLKVATSSKIFDPADSLRGAGAEGADGGCCAEGVRMGPLDAATTNWPDAIGCAARSRSLVSPASIGATVL